MSRDPSSPATRMLNSRAVEGGVHNAHSTPPPPPCRIGVGNGFVE